MSNFTTLSNYEMSNHLWSSNKLVATSNMSYTLSNQVSNKVNYSNLYVDYKFYSTKSNLYIDPEVFGDGSNPFMITFSNSNVITS
jgi:hypothetical protein